MTLIPSYFNLYDYFLRDERIDQSQIAIEFRGGLITYRELRKEVDYWAEHLKGCAVAEGDRVALLLYDSPEFVASFLATVSIGAICVPINTFIPPEECMFILADSGARLLIAEEELEWKIDLSDPKFSDKCAMLVVDTAARHYLDPKDDVADRDHFPATTRETPAFLLYTSGSTGRPKGAIHLHGSIPATVETYSRGVLGLAAADRVYSASRLFFAYGLGNSLSFPLAAGATVILDTSRPNAEYLAGLFEEQRPTIFFGVPAIYQALLDWKAIGNAVDTSSIRMCVSAGEALPARIFEEWQDRFGLEILDGIGSTEMLHIFISNRKGSAKPGSSGKTVEGYETRLVDERGGDAAGAESGNLWVRGQSAMQGYWNRADLTGETIQEGWVRTGDLYRRDEAGFYYHLGRSDDCFKVRGLWVSPLEVESALLAHDLVAESAVVAATGEDGLATARAFVVIRQDGERVPTEGELLEFLRGRLPQYKVPTAIEFLTDLPRTSTGKIQRYRLRARTHPTAPRRPDDL